ncbi:MAG: PTS sugar transporter subunit IIA [Anaerolineaceae bacterium]|nr:PTS sugar transporter subunit IIA [Anaerolineaceae bacterium]
MSWIQREAIRVNVPARNWQAAVRAAGKLLVKNHFVERRYIKGMIDTVKELGPYIVIIPGVAMPHARPEMGVIKSGFSLITLKKPVNFGNEDNDPVHVVIAFCATDHHAHIESLRVLALRLSEETFVQDACNAKDVDALAEILLSA